MQKKFITIARENKMQTFIQYVIQPVMNQETFNGS